MERLAIDHPGTPLLLRLRYDDHTWVPRSIDFMEALPRDPNGKLYKRRLRDPYWEGKDRAI